MQNLSQADQPGPFSPLKLKVIVAGSRDITSYDTLEKAMNLIFRESLEMEDGNKIPPGSTKSTHSSQEDVPMDSELPTTQSSPSQSPLSSQPLEIVSGGARGVDALGEEWARRRGWTPTVFPARWELHGRRAGPIRNSEMATYADTAVILWDGSSRGTASLINALKAKGKPYYLFIRGPDNNFHLIQ